MPVKRGGEATVEIKPLNLQMVMVLVVGETELIVHRWSEKAKRQMLDKQMGRATEKKEKKDPQADYLASMYRLDDGRLGVPSAAFKSAIVGACRLFEGLPMTVAKQAIRVNGIPTRDGEILTPIAGEPRMREDMVRLESGVADIRYRAGFPNWSAEIGITFNASVITLEQLYNLVDAAGFGGICEWRPSAPKSSTGTYGCFRVKAG